MNPTTKPLYVRQPKYGITAAVALLHIADGSRLLNVEKSASLAGTPQSEAVRLGTAGDQHGIWPNVPH